MLNSTLEWLKKLLNSDNLPVSSLPKSAKAEIEHFCTVGFIVWERSGAGARYVIKNESAIKQLIDSNSYQGDMSQLTPKAKAVALHGDAHKGKDESFIQLLSATSSNVIWNNGYDILDLYEYSSKAGVAAIVAKVEDEWESNKPIGLVENQDLLIYAQNYFDKFNFDGSVVYYSGMLSKKLLQWLDYKQRGTSYIMFPDYDIVGLNNYIRVKNTLSHLVSLYIPDNLAELLVKYGKENALETQATRNAIEQSNDKNVLFVYNLLLKTGKGLDQEGLIL